MNIQEKDPTATSMLNGLLIQIEEKDNRIAELEDSLRTLHKSIYKFKKDAGNRYGVSVPGYEPHPLLVKEVT